MNLKEIFKREYRDRLIPLLLLFAVGVQVPLFLYGGGLCKCEYMHHIFAVIFFASLSLENLQVNFVLSASIIISIIAIYSLARFLVIKHIKKVIL